VVENNASIIDDTSMAYNISIGGSTSSAGNTCFGINQSQIIQVLDFI